MDFDRFWPKMTDFGAIWPKIALFFPKIYNFRKAIGLQNLLDLLKNSLK